MILLTTNIFSMFWLKCTQMRSLLSRSGHQNCGRRAKSLWIIRNLAMFQQYFSFLFETWLKAAWSCFFYPSSKFSLLPSYATLISSYTAIVDRIAVVILSSAACVIISVLLLWCLLCNFPSIHRLYDWYLRRFSNGSSLMRLAFKLLFLTFVIMPNRCPKNVRRAE